MKGLSLMLAYTEGLPLRRKEVTKTHVATDAEAKERLATRPGYRKCLRDYIDWLDAKEDEGARNAPVEDLEEFQPSRDNAGEPNPETMTT